MKQNLRSAILLLASLLFVGTIFATDPPKKNNDKEDIRIEDLVHSDKYGGPERSLIPTVTGVLNHTTKTIHLDFRRSVGEVVVTITNKQGVVAISTRASTEMQILLPLPAAGEYKITIVGERYSGVSNFVID